MPSGAASAVPDEEMALLAPSLGDCYRVVGARDLGGAPVELAVRGGRFVEDAGCEQSLDAEGQVIVPALIDAHVHLAYLPREAALLRNGIAGAVDLGSPMSFLAHETSPLRLRRAGPMVTALGGYPTQSWGAGGYGLECADGPGCLAAADRLLDAGAALVKIPIGHAPELDDATLTTLVDHVHERGAVVVVHALSDRAVQRAASAGADVLAHTPTEALSESSVRAWSGRAVISTLGAFGGTPTTIENLRRLRAGGARVFYGTDFGNTRTAGIDARELGLLEEAGLDTAAILAAATLEPASFFGFPHLGALEAGRAASFLLVDVSAVEDPTALARPSLVVIDGAPQ